MTRSISMVVCVFGFFLVLLGQGASVAQADFVTSLKSDVTPLTGGLFAYTYTITNDTTSTLPAVEFTLNVDANANIQQLNGPDGWVISYNQGDTAVDWSSFLPLPGILPGTSSVLSFTSSLPPGPQSFSVLGISDTSFSIQTNQGTVDSPTSVVPEPTSMIPLGIGMVTLAGYSVYRGKRSP